MEARKKKAAAKKVKRKPSSNSVLAAKAIIDEKLKLYSQKESEPNIVEEGAVQYIKSKPKKAGKSTAPSNKEIEKKLKALKQLSGMFAGLWPLEDAQKYVNRLRSNDRY
jgi:hypothetical protein